MSRALIWKILERFGAQGVQFVVQIVLARVLVPDVYGEISVIIIFASIANVIVQNGFNTALVQAKDVEESDYTTILGISLIFALLCYCGLYIIAPSVELFFDLTNIVLPFRVYGLILFPGAINSIQIAKASRELNFKAIFCGSMVGCIISGFVGIYGAFNGWGIWALIAQNMISIIMSSFVMGYIVKIEYSLSISRNLVRLKRMFDYGWKLLLSSLIDSIYQNIQGVAIGKKYDANALAYNNRGQQFPQFVISAINGALQSVMLPVMSKKQDEKEALRELTRNTIIVSSYIVFPMMFGLAAIAPQLVDLVLTEKWEPCIPFLQLYCVSYVLWPTHICNLQVINSIGRSDIFLKLEIIKKCVGLVMIFGALIWGRSPLSIALVGAMSSVIGFYINAAPNGNLISYSFGSQVRDLAPILGMTVFMFAGVRFASMIPMQKIFLLFVQILIGFLLYLGMSVITKSKALKLIKIIIQRGEI